MRTRLLVICLVQLHKTAEPALLPVQAMDVVSLLLSSVAKGIAARLATLLERKCGADRSL